MLQCIGWKISDHIYRAVKCSFGKSFWMSLGRAFADEQHWTGTGAVELASVRTACSDTSSIVHSLRHSLPRSGTLHGLFPLHHTQAALTHHPQDRPQTGCAMSHCPVIKKERHRRLGPGLPLSFLSFSCQVSFPSSSIWADSGFPSSDKEKSNHSYLFLRRGPNQTSFWNFTCFLLCECSVTSRFLNTIPLCGLVCLSIEWI